MSSGLDLAQIAEGCDLECKLAAGKDGQGELPRSFFDSYSAMANTSGGVILLGVEEKPRGRFTARGVPDHERVRSNLSNLLNNPQKSAPTS